MPLKHFQQAAIWKAITGRDAYGKPTTTSTNITCEFIPESGIKRTKEGDDIKYNAKVAFIPASGGPKPGDFINLQDANLSSLTQFYNKDVPILDYVHAVMHWGTVKWYEVLL